MKNIPDTAVYAYLLDAKMKTISNKGIRGEVRFFFSDSTNLDVRLDSTAGDAFRAKAIPGFYASKITFHFFGKDVSALFEKQEQIVQKK
jgi:hypothetical protein